MKWMLLLALAGCYQRDLGNCAVACATSSDCPDGLACTASGRCATSETTACGAETDGGTDGMPDGPPATGTIHVVATDDRGLPAIGLRVIASQGTTALADVTTLADGTAELPDITGSADVTVIFTNGSGSKLTTIREVAPETTVMFGRRRNDAPSVTRTITWPTNASASSYVVFSSCTPQSKQVTAQAGATNSTTLQLDPTCADNFDVIVTFTDGALQTSGVAKANNTGNVTLTGAYTPFSPEDLAYAQLPPDVALGNIRVTGRSIFRSADLAIGPGAFGITAGGSGGATAILAMPVLAGREIYTTCSHDPDEFERTIQIAERVPAQGQYNLAIEPQLLPWITLEPAFDLGARTVTWEQLSSGPTSRTSGDLAMAEIHYARGALDFSWRIIAPPSAIASSGGTFELGYPDLPGTEDFEPRATDTLEGLQHLRLYGFTSTVGQPVSYAQLSPVADLAIDTEAAYDIFKPSDTGFLSTGLGGVDLARLVVSLNKPN